MFGVRERRQGDRSFCEMVGLVAGEEERRMLKSDWKVYGRRSSTVYAGATFGAEATFGRTFLLDVVQGPPATVAINEQDPAQVFMLRASSPTSVGSRTVR